MEAITVILILSFIFLLVRYIQNRTKVYTKGIIKGKFINYSSNSGTHKYYVTVQYETIKDINMGRITVKESVTVEVTQELYDTLEVDVFFPVNVNL